MAEKMAALVPAWNMPVIKKKIVQQRSACSGMVVQMKKAAHAKAQVGHIQTMLQAIYIRMLGNILHRQDVRLL
ncbi:MAG: hypothetical protein ACLSB9_00720 [Hydrogeniiclostridium mannosilyticum]